MFTKQYQEFKKAQFLGGSCYLTTWDNSKQTFYFNSSSYLTSDLGWAMKKGRCKNVTYISNGTSTPENYAGVYFGSGSTPATENDYKLDSLIASGLSIVSGSAVTISKLGNGKYEVFNTYTVRNTTDTEINIYEIGAVVEQTKAFNGYDYYVWPILIERTVLPEPITIKAGEAKIITYKVTFNQTLNVEV